jgi:methyltransferase (TIGR00027 family)
MHKNRASFTAAAVSAARGIAGVDRVAEGFASGPLGVLLRLPIGDRRRRLVNVATLGLVDHQELRTRAIDAVVREGERTGVRQLVILGAGLDARGFRMPELAETRVLEVDHAATQAYKRARTRDLATLAREVRFVPIDFEREELGDVLRRGGHDAARPTTWIWEGVTPYLVIDAVRATLAVLGARSAPGSRLAVTYGTPQGSRAGPAFVRLAKAGFRAIGEELRGLMTPEQVREELERVGLRVVHDTSPRDWAERFGGGRRILLVEERLAVAAR